MQKACRYILANEELFESSSRVEKQARQLGVILLIEDCLRVEPLLQQYERGFRDTSSETEEEKLRLVEQAANDPLFLADLREVMNDFKHVTARAKNFAEAEFLAAL